MRRSTSAQRSRSPDTAMSWQPSGPSATARQRACRRRSTMRSDKPAARASCRSHCMTKCGGSATYGQASPLSGPSTHTPAPDDERPSDVAVGLVTDDCLQHGEGELVGLELVVFRPSPRIESGPREDQTECLAGSEHADYGPLWMYGAHSSGACGYRARSRVTAPCRARAAPAASGAPCA